MKTHIRPILGLAALLACATPALAEWEGTQWGMSPDEALAVLDGAVSHKPDASEIYEFAGARYEPLVRLDHSVGGIEGKALLLFDTDDALHSVVFTPEDLARCDDLTAALTEAHGAVESTGFGSTAIYNWVEGDVIRHTNSPDIGICNLSYSAE
nr:hypothetical protein [uncultured Devosia sp.]